MRLWAEISRSHFLHNVRLIKEFVKPADLMLVVKANAYGHDLKIISELSSEAGIRWLGVTSLQEAEILVNNNAKARVLCFFEPEDVEEAEYLIEKNVAFNLFTQRGLEILLKALNKREKVARVHIKLNTGMNRLGLKPEEFFSFYEDVSRLNKVKIEGLWTHLATAEKAGSEFVDEQLKKFSNVALPLKKANPELILHAANTGGALFYPNSRFDLVRVGIGAYGYYPSFNNERPLPLKPALTLKARITAVSRLFPGEGVSYGLHWKAPSETTVGIVPAGYADGVPYSASGKIKVRYRGYEYFQVGSICMDQFAVDFKGLVPGINDEVEIIYENQTAEDLAKASGTITYEILTRIGRRVKRVLVP